MTLLVSTRRSLLNNNRSWYQNGSPLANSLVGYWKLDESSGNREDSVGSNTLTDNNTVAGASGLVHGTAGSFASASSEYLSIADNAALSMGDIDFWIAGWVYPTTDSGSLMTIVTKNAAVANREYRLYLHRQALNDYRPTWLAMLNNTSSQFILWPSAINQNAWHFLAVYHDSINNLIGLSVDGSAFTTAAYSAGVADSTSAFEIGRLAETSGNFFNGRVGPVMVGKNYVPTSSDIAFLYNNGLGRQ